MIGLRAIFSRLGAVAAAAATLVPAAASAQTITNVATLEWDAGPQHQVRQSNPVTLTLAPRASTFSLFHFSGDPGAQTLTVGDAGCAVSGAASVQQQSADAPAALRPASVAPAHAIHASDALILSYASAADNRDAAKVETVSITVEGMAGDRETVLLTETSADSGVFTSYIRTVAVSPAPVAGDCRLSARAGEPLALAIARSDDGRAIARSTVDILIDPYGVTFDSGDGSPVAGTRVTLIDDATGQPAQVFGDDGVSSFPSSVVTGSTVTDSGGASYAFPPGDYRFPLARPGRYRLRVEPPAPYTAPSVVQPGDLAAFRNAEGEPYTIAPGSYGGVFVLATPAPVRIDIPLDKPGGPIGLVKTASRPVAEPGDVVQFRLVASNSGTRPTGALTITDYLPAQMRLRTDTVRIDGAKAPATVFADGRTVDIALDRLLAGRSAVVTYLVDVRPDARPGDALNRAQARDTLGAASDLVGANVRIARDAIADRMTIVGRVTEGGCMVDPDKAVGIPGVRVLLEDGSYSVTDRDGRYHFEGVVPGQHVVQVEPATFPADRAPIDCAVNVQSAGSAISRFVEGAGGSVKRVDFRATAVAPRETAASAPFQRPQALGDAEAAGARTDWFAVPGAEIDWLFPAADHNPRTRAVRVAVRHLPGQKVALSVDGKPVDPVAFDGAAVAPDGARAVSLWRGVPLDGARTRLVAEVREADGTLIKTLTRDVHYAASPLFAQLIKDRSRLVADGVTRPVIAVRLTDRDGRPVHHGLVGDFAVPAPYYPAVEADTQAARQLSGLERARPVWRVEGDDGIATIELEPTTASGTLAVTFPFRDGEANRVQRLEAWLDPGDRPWTIVGFAAGTAGFNTLDARSERLGQGGETWYTDARLALYAKGRVRGKWLMTLAYDSDKERDDTRFQGTIDPDAYYTIYADRSERRYDAASVRRLYLRLERPQFYALFGDYETGFDEAELTRYVRSFNGGKAEFNNGRVKASAFVADTPFRHRREELQGNGLGGPYALAARDILANSETVTIEVRDRLRSERILERTVLTRYVDYDIDYIAGTIRFKAPVLSRSSSLDPQIIVVDYEVDGIGERVLNAGGRAQWKSADGRLQVAATALRDETDTDTTYVGGADLRFRPTAATEIRAELAVSDRSAKRGAQVGEGTDTAWLVEAEHHGRKLDLLAYARQQDAGFGVGQTSLAEGGTRKFGADARVKLTDTLSASAKAWQETYLVGEARRRAGEALLEYRTKSTDLRAGVIVADDRLADGRDAQSTIAQLGATRRLFGNRLEIDGQTEFALGDQNESVDFPARHRLSARFAVTPDVALVGAYELASSENVDARTARVGFDLKPWTGARFVSSLGQQDIAEYGPRTFAAYGLAQSLPLGKRWTIDASIDGNRTLGGIDPSRVLNPNHPVASGGFLASDGGITEDFTALTAGASYRGDRWSWTGRAELRTGDTGDRYGLTTAALRQIGEGRALGGQLSWFHADSPTGVKTETARAAISWAHRPADSRWTILEKLELTSDTVRNATAGESGPIGGAPITIQGDATSRRVVNSLSVNFSPTSATGDGGDRGFLDRGEYAVFWGSRYIFDKFDADDIKGWSNIVGLDARFDLSDTIAIGAQGSVRQGNGGRTISYAGGPAITIAPFDNSAITVGYNVVGFHDRDFEDARYTRSGPFVTLKLKFDQTSLAALGLARR